MCQADSALCIFDTQAATENAVCTRGNASFDMKKQSLVGKGHHRGEEPMDFYKFEADPSAESDPLVMRRSAEDQEKALSVLAQLTTSVAA